MAGHEVKKARDGDEALRIAAQFQPRVALFDVGTPRMSGYLVAEKIRAQPWGEEMTLIAVTGYGARRQAAEALCRGFDYHFRKPVKLEHLLGVFPV